MFRLTKQVFNGLLGNIVYALNYKKCISLKNQQCMIQPTLITCIPMNMVKDYIAINLHLIVTSVGSCVANLWQSRRFKLEYFSYDYRNK